MVFAEPELADRAPLKSAVDSVRGVQRSSSSSSSLATSASSSSSGASGEREWKAPLNPPAASVDERPLGNPNDLSHAEAAISGPSSSSASRASTPSTPRKTPQHPLLAPSPIPSSSTTTPTAVATLKHAPGRRSSGWFGSFGRKTITATTATASLATPIPTPTAASSSSRGTTPKRKDNQKGKQRAASPRMDVRDLFAATTAEAQEIGLPPVLKITEEFPDPVSGSSSAGGKGEVVASTKSPLGATTKEVGAEAAGVEDLSLSASLLGAAEAEEALSASTMTITPKTYATSTPTPTPTSAPAPAPAAAPAPAPAPAPVPTHVAAAAATPLPSSSSSSLVPVPQPASMPASASTSPLPSPRKRSWFYRSSAKDSGSSSSLVKPAASRNASPTPIRIPIGVTPEAAALLTPGTASVLKELGTAIDTELKKSASTTIEESVVSPPKLKVEESVVVASAAAAATTTAFAIPPPPPSSSTLVPVPPRMPASASASASTTTSPLPSPRKRSWFYRSSAKDSDSANNSSSSLVPNAKGAAPPVGLPSPPPVAALGGSAAGAPEVAALLTSATASVLKELGKVVEGEETKQEEESAVSAPKPKAEESATTSGGEKVSKSDMESPPLPRSFSSPEPTLPQVKTLEATGTGTTTAPPSATTAAASSVSAPTSMPSTPPPAASGGSRFMLGIPFLGGSKAKTTPVPTPASGSEEKDKADSKTAGEQKGTAKNEGLGVNGAGCDETRSAKQPSTVTDSSTPAAPSALASTSTTSTSTPALTSASTKTPASSSSSSAQVNGSSSNGTRSEPEVSAAAANAASGQYSSPLAVKTNANAPSIDNNASSSESDSTTSRTQAVDGVAQGRSQAQEEGTGIASETRLDGEAAVGSGESGPSDESQPDGTGSTAMAATGYSTWWNYVGWGNGQPTSSSSGQPPLSTQDGESATPAPGQAKSDTAAKADADDEITAAEGGSDKTAGVGSTQTATTTGTLSTTSTSTATIPAKGTVIAELLDHGVSAAGMSSSPDGNRGTTEKDVGGELDGEKTEKKNLGGDGNGKKSGVVDFDAGNSGVSTITGSDRESNSETAAGRDGDGQNVEDGRKEDSADPGSSTWYSPWGWYYGSSTTTTSSETRHLENGQATTSTTTETTTTIAAVEGSDSQAERVVEVTGVVSVTKGGNGDVAQVVSGSNMDAKVEQDRGKEQQYDNKADPSSGEDTVNRAATTASDSDAKSQNEPVNPIEASFNANRSGWASFFNSQSLVKAIGYRSTTPTIESRPVKRDENGMEIMDIDDDSDSEDAPSEAETENRESRSRSLGPKLLTFPVQSTTGPGGDTSLTPRNSSPQPAKKEKPADPLTGDQDLKRQVAQSLPTEKRSKSVSGTSTPQPPLSPSSTGSASPASTTGGKTQPPPGEKSRSAPVTPKRGASPAPSTTKKSNSTSSAPNLVLPTWADTFHAPPRSVVLKTPSVTPPGSPEESHEAEVGSGLLGKTMKFVSGVLFSKGEATDQGQQKTDHGVSSIRGGRRTSSRASMKPPHPLRRSSSSGGVGTGGSNLDIASLLEQERKVRFERFGQELPKSWDVIEGGGISNPADASGRQLEQQVSEVNLGIQSADQLSDSVVIKDVLRGCRRVVIIGVHGWFPGAMMRTVLGEPTGTSSKFANMMAQAIQEFEREHGASLEKVTKIPLEGEGTIEKRVEKLFTSLVSNKEWMDDLRDADVLFVATHSQGSVVSTHLLDRLIQDKLICTQREDASISAEDSFPSAVGISMPSERKLQRVCCLALCGIHLGPLRYLSSSSLVAPYIQYFESAAARELFEFQDTESAVSKAYVKALHNVLDHGVKMVYIASLNDQVVPIYSGIFTAASHPLILRALYIDGDAYHSSDFLSNLLVLLLRLRNCGIPDGGLLAHLSEATAGSLSGVGHSTAYEDLATYSLAVRYLFLTNNGTEKHPSLVIEPFNAAHEQNDYEIPWSLRDVIADERVIHFFSNEVGKLRDAFRDWHPKTTILRDLKRKLQPIQRLPSSFTSGFYSTPKL
ncbi:hypothetical protein EST38_g8577 [Candolleomyces aberdarensis]|uniref:YMC020W-like alpha/beta hydrolase domain-containing protein n=1 Tax=Candolleomyces aberdarensis TaxID=2316362 RepID=A0A4V1Q342_9AGAR|nr:hypothetical protein EST38_g8577 [Candolleomyces aberdarensis]